MSKMRQVPDAPFLKRVYVVSERVPAYEGFPYGLPFVRDFDLSFKRAVTFLVGENGSGKSTLIEAIAEACGLPVSGGGRNEAADRHGPEQHSALGSALRTSFSRRPKDGYFFRAEFQANFASLLDQRREDPDFEGDPYSRYGGRSLHAQSHGEAFLAILLNRVRSGVIIMDEPESALSPQRQLALLTRMADLVATGRTQFIVATHSPVLLTYPDADIVSFDDIPVRSVKLEDTSHYQITRGILEAPERYWRLLRKKAMDDEGPA
jgi:predicted ATPase